MILIEETAGSVDWFLRSLRVLRYLKPVRTSPLPAPYPFPDRSMGREASMSLGRGCPPHQTRVRVEHEPSERLSPHSQQPLSQRPLGVDGNGSCPREHSQRLTEQRDQNCSRIRGDEGVLPCFASITFVLLALPITTLKMGLNESQVHQRAPPVSTLCHCSRRDLRTSVLVRGGSSAAP